MEPISVRVGELAAEQSGGELNVTVDGPGTGDGFALFCEGETDISDASRPIAEDEIAACEGNGIEYVELEVAIDGLTVATNPANADVTCLDVAALVLADRAGVGRLRELVGRDGSGDRARLGVAPVPGCVRSTSPVPVRSPARTTRSSSSRSARSPRTAVRTRSPRADYNASANDNLIVDGIEGSDSSLGWVGYAYYLAEQDAMKALEIDGGDGCVAPTTETISGGTYPFSRSLYIYVNSAKAAENPAVASFVDLYLSDAGLASVSAAGYVDLPADRVAASRDAWANH